MELPDLSMRLANPWALAGLLLVPTLLVRYLWMQRRGLPTLLYSSLELVKPLAASPWIRWRRPATSSGSTLATEVAITTCWRTGNASVSTRAFRPRGSSSGRSTPRP